MQLIPGSPNAPPIRDGGSIPQGQVQSEVQLSDIFNAFDPTTRHAFQVWQQQLSTAVSGNDQNLNDVLGNLPSFAADASDVLQVLDVQHQAVVSLLQNGGTVFGALGANQTALQNLITSGEKTFATTAANNNQLAKTFEVFPTFLNETKTTMQKLQAFSVNTDPLIKELDPVAQQLKPTLQSVQQLSPPLRHLFTNLGPLITVSQTGLPAVHNILTGLEPTLGSLGTFLEQLNPILGWLSDHQQLISDFISNGASPIAATTTSFSATASATTCASSRRPARRRCRSRPTATRTTAATPTPGPSGWPIRRYSPRATSRRGTARTPARAATAPWASGSAGTPGSQEACWVAPALPGASQGQIPHLLQASYPSK